MIAALLNIGVLHFSAHPRHIVYLATYVVVMVGADGIAARRWWTLELDATGETIWPPGSPA